MNKITKIFNNVGFYCSLENNCFIYNSTINSYQFLSDDSIGYYIPYLVRNLNDNYKWEIGVGEVIYHNNKLAVKRIEISSSSNNNNNVNFSSNRNEFYLFVNNINFNSSFNNVILKNDHFNIDNITTIYLVDNSEKTIDCVLPDATKARNVVIDIKALTENNNIKVRLDNGEIFASTNNIVRLVSNGQTWYILNTVDSTLNYGSLLSQDSLFSTQSNPTGEDYSFQYKDGTDLIGSNLYWGSGNSNKLLLGSNSESIAHTIIPTSGNEPVVFNKDLKNADFIIYGSGSPHRNLFFTYDGRVGINIPSGSRPQTVFHVVNYSCSEILRLENRTNCQPAKLTIYHKPSGISNGSICSILSLSGRDANNNQKDYATIQSTASDVSNGFGEISISVSSGNIQKNLISGNLTNISVGYEDNKKLLINSNGNIVLSGTNLDARSSSSTTIGTTNNNITFTNSNRNISFNHSSLSLGSGSITANGSLLSNNLSASNLTLPNIAPSSILSLDSSRKIVPISGISINSQTNKIVLNNIQPNRILTTDSNKNMVGVYDLNDYFLTENDIVWNKYSPRGASVCLKQVVFDDLVPLEEFAVGDQIEINTDSGSIYRTIVNIEFNNNQISGLRLDQNVTTNSVSNITLLSITKGGYLLIQKNTSGAISDSTTNIISARPGLETVFNQGKKDIDFTVYGADILPALKVHANIGSSSRQSGIYYSFATKEDSIDPIIVNYGGSGLSNTFSTANYNYSPNINQFTGVLSTVGTNGNSSYYGTYDQNGNVSEWLESENSELGIKEKLTQQRCAGGSYLSDVNNLRGIEIVEATGFYSTVGFRIASLINIVDNTSISSGLNINFSLVTNPNNISDTGVLKVNNIDNLFFNLGVVNKNYRIGTYEITNNQYASFLNSVATGVNGIDASTSSGLYNPGMSGIYGGINRFSSDIVHQYVVKNNMGNKPVNFISYINSLRFINWIENGAPPSINAGTANEIINQGSYEILQDGNGNYSIDTNVNRRYFLPSLNQWHKAAYFEYKDSTLTSGTPVVSINTDTPYVVATEKITDTVTNPKKIIADLTVSGWLVVDKIIVKDGTLRSSLNDIDFDIETGSSNNIIPTGDIVYSLSGIPPVSGDIYWNNSTAIVRSDGVFGTIFPPLPPNGDGTELETDCLDLSNIPFWCRENGRLNGPYFY